MTSDLALREAIIALLRSDAEVISKLTDNLALLIRIVRQSNPDFDLDDSILIDAQKTAHQSRKAADAL